MVLALLLLYRQHATKLDAFLLVPKHLAVVIVLDQVDSIFYLCDFALTDLYSVEIVVFLLLISETVAELPLEVKAVLGELWLIAPLAVGEYGFVGVVVSLGVAKAKQGLLKGDGVIANLGKQILCLVKEYAGALVLRAGLQVGVPQSL